MHTASNCQRRSYQKAVGPPPLPGRWPSDPYRPVTGLRNRSLRSCPAGRASLIEVSNHRWTFAALLRIAVQGSNTLGRAIVVPNRSIRQILTNSLFRPVGLSKNRRNCRLTLRFSEGLKTINRNYGARTGSRPGDETPAEPARLTPESRVFWPASAFLSFDPRSFCSYIIRCSRPHCSLPAPLSPVPQARKLLKQDAEGGPPCPSGAARTP